MFFRFGGLRLGTRVMAGFGCVLLLLLLVGGGSVLVFQRVSTGVEQFKQRVAVARLIAQVNSDTAQLHQRVRAFAVSGDPGQREAVQELQDALGARIERGLTLIRSPDQLAHMRQLADGHAAYRAGFERVAALKTQDAAIADRLEAMGAQLSDRLDTLMVAAAQDGNASAVTIGQAMLPYLTQIRLNANTFVSRGVARARVRTQMRLGQLERVFDELDQATRERPYRADVEQFKALSLQYGEVFERYAALRRQLDELIGGELLQAGTTMAQAAEAIDNSAREAQQLIEQETTALLGSMSFVVLALSVGSAVVGLLLAWFVGRGLSRSVIGLTGVMGRLAEGDHSVEIPGTGRRDELGVMAKAVLVFKESMIRLPRRRTKCGRLLPR
jgi:CHASE3 domain sensor protein